jgi:hypothetical protein
MPIRGKDWWSALVQPAEQAGLGLPGGLGTLVPDTLGVAGLLQRGTRMRAQVAITCVALLMACRNAGTGAESVGKPDDSTAQAASRGTAKLGPVPDPAAVRGWGEGACSRWKRWWLSGPRIVFVRPIGNGSEAKP